MEEERWLLARGRERFGNQIKNRKLVVDERSALLFFFFSFFLSIDARTGPLLALLFVRIQSRRSDYYTRLSTRERDADKAACLVSRKRARA